MEAPLGFFHLIQGGQRGSQINTNPKKLSSGSPHKDIFICSHPQIRVKNRFGLDQMETYQGSFPLGRGGGAVYGMKIKICPTVTIIKLKQFKHAFVSFSIHMISCNCHILNFHTYGVFLCGGI
jgi:hypothetical protein